MHYYGITRFIVLRNDARYNTSYPNVTAMTVMRKPKNNSNFLRPYLSKNKNVKVSITVSRTPPYIGSLFQKIFHLKFAIYNKVIGFIIVEEVQEIAPFHASILMLTVEAFHQAKCLLILYNVINRPKLYQSSTRIINCQIDII